MAGRRVGDAPGIGGLLDLIDDHGEAVEFDLIALGLRLRDIGVTFSWRDLKVIVSRGDATSAVARATDPQNAAWSDLTALLLREVVYEMQLARRQQAGKGPMPKRIPLPGEDGDSSHFGSEPLELEDMAEWLGGAFATEARQN